MDAHALLTSQGWRGHGHTLHASSDKIGILNPILVAHKKDNSGLGAGKATVDQWWLSAIDEQLKGLDTSKGKPVQMVSGGIIGRMDQRYARTRLYENFVKGEILGSTIQENIEVIEERRRQEYEEKRKRAKKEASESGSSSKNDSKSDSESEVEKKSKNLSKPKASDKEIKAEKRTRKAVKKARKAAKEAKKETKALRRAARAERNKLKVAKRADREAKKKEKEVRRTKKLEKRKSKA